MVPLRSRARPGRRVVVLTGAGISVASGLPTYRGAGGLWTANPELEEALSAGASPEVVWRGLAPLRAAVSKAEPNAAHVALAAWERRVVDQGGSCTLVTQNVDGLHTRAGSSNVIEYHGALRRSRCSDGGCPSRPFEDDRGSDTPPPCATCGAPLRPDVVLFGEMIGAREEVESKRALRDCDLFVAIGTSGTVWPASSFVRAAQYAGAHTILVNLEPIDDSPYDEVIVGAAETVVPALVG
ncbi:MAG: NAD-dependent deacylase [Deltaproteobacteria bacterium]|nr:NAD-dependent deacylase [Deltaproteobacteria bacterium]